MPDVVGKLLPRNLAALRVGQDAATAIAQVAGNPASTLLQSGVGNCFPGLEFDMRNLERRFFPFLEVDTDFSEISVVGVDSQGVADAMAAGSIDAATEGAYQAVAAAIGTPGQRWKVVRIEGDFGPLGALDVTVAQLAGQPSFGPNRLPSDAWTAIRLLKEDSQVKLTLQSPQGKTLQLTAARARYLDPNGALAAMFEVGELTQSLCSPWTHDFRDCGCYYWATNHPDIALPPAPPSGAPQPAGNLPTAWLRADRSSPEPAADARDSIAEIPHNAINSAWQTLNVVLERRETVTPYVQQPLSSQPLPDLATLNAHLQFAAGVELAVMQEYLVAAWSLKLSAGTQEPLKGDLRSAFYELQQVAIGEMRHLRMVNEVLRQLMGASYTPALRVASQVPLGAGQWRPLSFRALTPDVMAEFVEVEAPSQSVDSLYARILATLESMTGMDNPTQSVRTIMAEGAEHWQTFLFVQEWLGRHAPSDYLRATLPAAPGLAQQQTLQTRYVALLGSLYGGYAKGLPLGASDVNSARAAMLGANGIEGALEAVAATGVLAHFDQLADPRFAPIGPPP